MNKTRKTFSYAKYGYLFSLPFIIAFLVFSLYPTIYTAILGFTDCKGLGNTDWHLLTDDLWANFRKIFKNQMFKTSLQNTLVIWIVNFIPQMTIALVLTAWFTSHSFDIKGKGFFKVVFYMPNIITAIHFSLTPRDLSTTCSRTLASSRPTMISTRIRWYQSWSWPLSSSGCGTEIP